MIKVSGVARLLVDFEVELNMTEDEFDALPESKQNDILENTINWRDALDGSETDDFEIYEVEEVGDEQSA